MRLLASFVLGFLLVFEVAAQELDSLRAANRELDSLYIAEVENPLERTKVLHAEPLYIDLIRDLGARKGEREWNLGIGLTDNLRYDTYQALIEYEWAPIDRLGLEIEVPMTIIAPYRKEKRDTVPSSRIESLKTAVQWSFFVSEKLKSSIALGYINELEFSDLNEFGNPLVRGNVYNPFLISAKRWGNNYHTLVYTGPRLEQNFQKKMWHLSYDLHTSFHYMISGTRNFIGVEVNNSWADKKVDTVVRPQMRVGVSPNFLIGILGGVPIHRDNQRFSMFMRLIWEPGARH